MDSIEERIYNIKESIRCLRECLPYADGQAYYQDLEELGKLTRELAELREMYDHGDDY